jgi:hypothetical protein
MSDPLIPGIMTCVVSMHTKLEELDRSIHEISEKLDRLSTKVGTKMPNECAHCRTPLCNHCGEPWTPGPEPNTFWPCKCAKSQSQQGE